MHPTGTCNIRFKKKQNVPIDAPKKCDFRDKGTFHTAMIMKVNKHQMAESQK